MATSSRSAERFKYGICLNDECPLCKEKKIQQIPMRKELVCTNPECGKPLRECPPPQKGPKWKKIAAIVGAVAGIAAIGGGAYLLWPNEEQETNTETNNSSIEPTPKIELSLNHQNKTLKVGEKDTLKATIMPERAEATYIWKASKDGTLEVQEGIVKAIKEGNGRIQVQAIVGKDTLKRVCKYTVEKAKTEEPVGEPRPVEEPKPKPTPSEPYEGTLKLSYGTYHGKIENGYPNGQGRLVYSTSRQINKNDPKGREASAGDVVQGQFVNGFITIGKHYDSAGNFIESINVGVVDGQYESK